MLADFNGTKTAYKEVITSSINEETLDRFFEELKLIGTLRHPNIAQCLGVVWEVDEHGILFELCKNGSLDDFLKTYNNLGYISWRATKKAQEQKEAGMRNSIRTTPESGGKTQTMLLLRGVGLKTAWALGIAKGCAFLHGRNPPIVHRDLKCANILVSDDLTAKITDFGESRSVGGQDENTMTTVGTPYFMAPEVFSSDDEDKQYSKEVDVYSYGMLLLEIFYDGDIRKAFKKTWGPMIVMNRVGNGWRPDLTPVEEDDRPLADMIRKCWDADPLKRPSFKELIKFFQVREMKLGLQTKMMHEKKADKKEEKLKEEEKKLRAKSAVVTEKNKKFAFLDRPQTTSSGRQDKKVGFLDNILKTGEMPKPIETPSHRENREKQEQAEVESAASLLMSDIRYSGR